MFSFFQKSEKEIDLLLDIGSASIGAALVLFSKEAKPEVIYATRVPIAVPEKVTPDAIVSGMLSHTEKAVERVWTEGIRHLNFTSLGQRKVRNAYCIFSSPWFASRTKIISINKDKPIVLAKSFMDDILRQEKENFEHEEKEFGKDAVLVEQKIIQSKLNGYETANPYGKKAKHVELAVFMSLVPKNIVSGVESAVHKHFHVRDIAFNTYALVAYSTILDVFPADSQALILDITGEVTDISFIKNDILLETYTVPFGRNTILRKISSQKEVSPEISLSLLRLYTDGKAESRLYSEIDAVVASLKPQWDKLFREVEETIKKKSSLPRTVFLSADVDIVPIFERYLLTDASMKIVSADGIERSASSVQYDKIIPLDHEHLSDLVLFKNNIPKDPFIAASTYFLQRVI